MVPAARGVAAAEGHTVTYLTRRQWPADERPAIAGVEVVAVSRDEPLYGPDGSRRIGQALRFGLGVLCHLARHRGRYDVVHTCSFPYFSVLGARAATLRAPVELIVDWFEVWTRDYWLCYAGRTAGCASPRVRLLVAAR